MNKPNRAAQKEKLSRKKWPTIHLGALSHHKSAIMGGAGGKSPPRDETKEGKERRIESGLETESGLEIESGAPLLDAL